MDFHGFILPQPDQVEFAVANRQSYILNIKEFSTAVSKI
jgi:hypothetical protein